MLATYLHVVLAISVLLSPLAGSTHAPAGAPIAWPNLSGLVAVGSSFVAATGAALAALSLEPARTAEAHNTHRDTDVAAGTDSHVPCGGVLCLTGGPEVTLATFHQMSPTGGTLVLNGTYGDNPNLSGDIGGTFSLVLRCANDGVVDMSSGGVVSRVDQVASRSQGQAPIPWSVEDDAKLTTGTTCTQLALNAFTNSGASILLTWTAKYRVHCLSVFGLICVPLPVLSRHGPPFVNGAGSRDPVHTLTGAFTYSRTDVALAGRGPTPGFMRTYNSLDLREETLGRGWTHNYATRLADASGGGTTAVYLIGPQGRADRYTYNSTTGAFTPPDGVNTQLSRNATSGVWTATHPDRSTLTFDSSGKLTAIADRYGNTSTLSYDTTTGRLTSVSDPARRDGSGAAVLLTFAYDSCTNGTGRLCSVTDWQEDASGNPAPRVVEFAYDSSGRLQTVADREDNTTIYGYGTSGFLETITDDNTHVAVTNTYDSGGRVIEQADARGATTTFCYRDASLCPGVTRVTYPANSFDGAALVEEDTYDSLGRITQRVSKPTNSSADDITVTSAYTSAGLVESVTNGRGYTTNFCYDALGNVTRRVDPSSDGAAARPITHLEYSGTDLLKVVAPKGVTMSTPTDCGATPTLDADGLYTTTYEYSTATSGPSLNALVATEQRYKEPGSSTVLVARTTFAYGDSENPGQVTKATSPRGNVASPTRPADCDSGSTPAVADCYATTFTYYNAKSTPDANTDPAQAGLLKAATDALGRTTTHTYDPVGRLLTATGPAVTAHDGATVQGTATYAYDAEDRVTSVKAPAPESGATVLETVLHYDGVGNRDWVTDPAGQITKFVYDVRDSLAEVHESPSAWTSVGSPPGDVIVTAYSYDDLGNLTRVRRAKDDSTHERVVDYAYDGLGRVRKETQYPSGGWPTNPNGSTASAKLETLTTYDKNGNVATSTDPLSQVTTLTYDRLDRLTDVDYSASGTPDVDYTYDAHGNRLTLVDHRSTGDETTEYTYDELDRVVEVDTPAQGGAPAQTVGYRYDRDGHRVKVIYPDATDVTYTVNGVGQVRAMSDWASRTTAFGYRADGALETVGHFNGTSTGYTYDRASRLRQVWHWEGLLATRADHTISRHTYTMDRRGNRTRVDEVLPELGVPGPIGFQPFGGSVYAAAPAVQPAGHLSTLAAAPASVAFAHAPTATPAALPLAAAQSRQGHAQLANPVEAFFGWMAGLFGGAQTAATTPMANLPNTASYAQVQPNPAPLASATPTATPSPSATTTTTRTPTPGTSPFRPAATAAPIRSAPVALAETGAHPDEEFAYQAVAGRTVARLFGKGGTAEVRLEHAGTDAVLAFSLPGVVANRARVGHKGRADVGRLAVEWAAHEDRLKEDIILQERPPQDHIDFDLRSRNLAFTPDGDGGHHARTPDGRDVFHLLPPTVEDARGRGGAVTLTLDPVAGRARLAVDPAFLAAAAYPVTIDPTVVYTGGAGDSTAYTNSPRLLRDAHGNLLLVSTDSANKLVFSHSTDGGATWTNSAQSGLSGTFDGPTWGLSADGAKLHLAYSKAGSGVWYRRLSVARDGANAVTGISLDGGEVQLESFGSARRPSLVVDKHDRPAVAFIASSSSQIRVLFRRATGDPTVSTNWRNGQNSGDMDTLAQVNGTDPTGQVALARMPAGSGNDDALYAFWYESANDDLNWRKATTNGTNYNGWSGTSTKATSVHVDDLELAVAPDPANDALVVAYYTDGSDLDRVFRKHGGGDGNGSDTALVTATTKITRQVSLAVDDGDVYLAFRTASGQLAYRKWTSAGGLDAGDTVLDSGATTNYPSARQSMDDGALDVAYTDGSNVKHVRVGGAPPTPTPTPTNTPTPTHTPTFTPTPTNTGTPTPTPRTVSTSYCYDQLSRLVVVRSAAQDDPARCATPTLATTPTNTPTHTPTPTNTPTPGGATDYPSQVLADAPIGYWRLGETSGSTAADSSGNGHAGTYGSGVTKNVAGALTGDTNKAISLATGLDDYVQITDEAAFDRGNGSSVTLEAWVRLTNFESGERETFIEKAPDGTRNYQFNVYGVSTSAGRLSLLYRAASGGATHEYRASGTNLAENTWYHVAATYTFGTGSSMKLYVNGVEVAGSWVSGDGNASPGQTNEAVRLGFDDQIDHTYTGDLDEVAIYGAALSAARLLAHYQAGTGTLPTPTPTNTAGPTNTPTNTPTATPTPVPNTVWRSYTYDPVGNRTKLRQNGADTAYTYDKADRVQTAGRVAYTVNANGNLTDRGTDDFAYDQANRLTQAIVGSTTTTYSYDGDGKRVTSTTGSVTTRSVYDAIDGLPTLLDDGTRKYVWGPAGLAYTVDKTSGAASVYHTDGLGSVRALTDASGDVTETAGTDEFGVPVAGLTQGVGGQPFGYTGEQEDGTGLVYLRARMYDPVLGRFLQRDSLMGDLQGSLSLHRFAYAVNSPVNLVDPTGYKPQPREAPSPPCLPFPRFGPNAGQPLPWTLGCFGGISPSRKKDDGASGKPSSPQVDKPTKQQCDQMQKLLRQVIRLAAN